MTCWQCFGSAGWHDCGEDTCSCLDPEEILVDCDICGGSGEIGDEGDERGADHG